MVSSFRKRHLKICQDFRVVVVFLGIIFLFMPNFAEACWGGTAPKYGEMTHDYDLLEGDTLILNCTLHSHQVKLEHEKKTTYYVNSTNLFFRKSSRISSDFIHTLDGLTAQLRIDSASAQHAGMYHCEMTVPELSVEHLVCTSKVNIGYPPKPVKNFKCISIYRENLTCTWDVPANGVQTKYTLSKNFPLSSFYSAPQLQECPSKSSNNTFCEWGENTDPPFQPQSEVFNFVLRGINQLGTIIQNFTLKHYEILLPNHPESLTVSVGKQNMTLTWSPPERMRSYMSKPPLKYQIWIQEMIKEGAETKVIDAGNDVLSYAVYDLIPHMKYNISLRCRSEYAPESMWGPVISVQKQTLPDVPRHTPTVTPEAFEVHHFDGYRTVTLYWQPVPEKYYNGDNFAYHVLCSYNNLTSLRVMPTIETINVTTLSVSFGSLGKDSAYRFQIYSMNDQGLSSDFKLFVLEAQHNIPALPERITAISYDAGHYNLSWKAPQNELKIVDYVVFWCSGLKPWLNRCDDPIHWLNTSLNTNNVVLNLTDNFTNYQFAVVARTAKASSGLQWATCIVPFKSALGKIPNVIVEPKNSTSLKVIWRLDCAAQKSVVKKFEIVYCQVNKHKQCKVPKRSVELHDSELENYILQDLQPFSNYSVIVRAYNEENRPSEDSDLKIQATLQGAPSDPPQDIAVIATSAASLHITWHQPRNPNGIVTHYYVHYNNEIKEVKVVTQKEKYELDIYDLLHYVNYSIRIQACVHHSCSSLSNPVVAVTDIGIPGEMDPPRIETVNTTLLKVSWNRPFMPNGPITFYEIQWKEMSNQNGSEKEHIEYKNVSTGLSTSVEISCSSFVDGGIRYLFSVRAVNRRQDGFIFYGPLSEPTQARACLLSQGLAMIVGAAIGGTLALAFVMLLIYKLIKWMSDKIHQMKSITVCLPEGLDGAETNPLSNYNFKKSLLQQTLNTAVIGRFSYSIDDVDNKNRHGSGSSQYSYSSTDELLYRNGKCARFARKPSGESSGCSSMSSNHTKIHPSSESSTESDFMTPPSPDLVFSDHGSHKTALPIVHEDKDSTSCEEVLKNSFTDGKKCGDTGEVVLKVEQPYSKFGISRCETTLPPWWVNSLAFYSVNLSNSEPSVKDIKDPVHVCMPYSKVGVTKSSEDVIGLKPTDFNIGYSRIGVPKGDESELYSFAVPLKNHDNVHCDPYMKGIVFVPHNQNKTTSSISSDQYFAKKEEDQIIPNMPSLIAFNSTEKEMNDDSGYIKFRRSAPLGAKSGYVPFNNVGDLYKSPYPLLRLPTDELDDPKVDLVNAELFSLGYKNYAQAGGSEISQPKFMEYNPDTVAVIFNDSLGVNMTPFSDHPEMNEVGSPTVDGNVFPNSFSNSGFKDDFSPVKNGFVDISSDDFEGIHIDFSSSSDNAVTTPFDSTLQPISSELKGLENVHLFNGNLECPSPCPPSFQLGAVSPVTSTDHLDNERPVQNGYVSVSALSNLNADTTHCMTKQLVPPENCVDTTVHRSPLMNTTEKNPNVNTAQDTSDNFIFEVPSVKTRSGDRSSKYKVYPLLDSIPKYSGNCKSNTYCSTETPNCTTVENGKSVFQFMPVRESEYCEV